MSNPIANGRLNLEQQKKRAKELLRQFNTERDAALKRFQPGDRWVGGIPLDSGACWMWHEQRG